MAYVTNQQLIDRVGNERASELTTDSGSVPDAGKVTAAREGAEGVVNSYLSPRYGTPVDLTADSQLRYTIEKLVLDIAEYDLRSLRPPVAEDYVRRRQEAVDLLGRYAKGEVSLPGVAEPEPPANQGAVVQIDGADRVFSREKMEGF